MLTTATSCAGTSPIGATAAPTLAGEGAERMIEQGEFRRWSPGVPTLDGMIVQVVGVADTGSPVIGRGYIVRLPDKANIPDYPYTHTIAFEAHLQ